MKKIDKNTCTFTYHNENPRGVVAMDCCIRAIAKATGKSWDNVYREISDVGFKLKDLPDTKKVITKYLKNLGYEMSKQIRDYDGVKYTAREFAKTHTTGTYVLTLRHHLSVLIDGKIYDTWDCGSSTVGNYWIIKL